ncbi:hypothetical protein BU24DRAFT_97719 [Aaosphaeria arxii CBS 175.79]|uniref:Uncharacterized protein n=1 Tax=Aaosphaeria arxii CBS 175.79 TaxID=1450172 RepID=A0A6A5X6H5_9PLEO|nr:uncharacterized protein BU24DRAFT_97719 [Aaosphaeria arxii CBS 175.79]KAF2008510.1 hypothetical protein BU24DRAFT_97719 [Aaosphaeria arxii CBS 175.79]
MKPLGSLAVALGSGIRTCCKGFAVSTNARACCPCNKQTTASNTSSMRKSNEDCSVCTEYWVDTLKVVTSSVLRGYCISFH